MIRKVTVLAIVTVLMSYCFSKEKIDSTATKKQTQSFDSVKVEGALKEQTVLVVTGQDLDTTKPVEPEKSFKEALKVDSDKEKIGRKQ